MQKPPEKTKKERETAERKVDAKPFRVGIVGAGLMGKWHARAAVKAGGKIVCIADIDEKQSASLAADYASAQCFKDAAKMLDQKSLDVIHICTPTFTHTELAEFVIKSQINLFIEKPLASTAAQTTHLYDLARENNVKICPAHQFAFQKGVQKAKKLLSGIGRIVHMQATIFSAGGEGFDNEQNDSIAADILPHPLSLFQSFLSDCLPEKNWEVLRPQAGELRVSGKAGEISLSIFVSMNARPTVNSFEIFGTKGTIYLDLFHGFAFLETGKVSKIRKILRPFDSAFKQFSAATFNLLRRTIQAESAYPGLRQLVKDFYQSIRENKEPPISPHQAINVAIVRDCLIRQSEMNKLGNKAVIKK
jgi:predicted dehydrogenase